jgi:hypothetical protein
MVEGKMVGPLARLARAQALLGTDSAAGATAPAAEAADALDRLGCRLFGAMAAEVAGNAATSHAAAIEMLARAVDGYDRCGAVVRRDRVAKRLAGLGYRGRLAAVAGRGPSSLTPREADVARLAARGHTAAEIGRQLFIGTATKGRAESRCWTTRPSTSSAPGKRTAATSTWPTTCGGTWGTTR